MERHLPVSQLLVWKNLRLRFGRMKCWPSWLVWAHTSRVEAPVFCVFFMLLPWLYLKICLDICLDWMLCICVSIAFCFTSLVSKIQTPRLHPVRSEKKDQTLKEFPTLTLFRFSQLLRCAKWRDGLDGDGWRWMERWNEFHCYWRSSSSVPLGSLEEFACGETTFEDPCEPKISHSAAGKDPAVGNTFPAVGLNHQKRKRGGNVFRELQGTWRIQMS